MVEADEVAAAVREALDGEAMEAVREAVVQALARRLAQAGACAVCGKATGQGAVARGPVGPLPPLRRARAAEEQGPQQGAQQDAEEDAEEEPQEDAEPQEELELEQDQDQEPEQEQDQERRPSMLYFRPQPGGAGAPASLHDTLSTVASEVPPAAAGAGFGEETGPDPVARAQQLLRELGLVRLRHLVGPRASTGVVLAQSALLVYFAVWAAGLGHGGWDPFSIVQNLIASLIFLVVMWSARKAVLRSAPLLLDTWSKFEPQARKAARQSAMRLSLIALVIHALLNLATVAAWGLNWTWFVALVVPGSLTQAAVLGTFRGGATIHAMAVRALHRRVRQIRRSSQVDIDALEAELDELAGKVKALSRTWEAALTALLLYGIQWLVFFIIQTAWNVSTDPTIDEVVLGLGFYLATLFALYAVLKPMTEIPREFRSVLEDINGLQAEGRSTLGHIRLVQKLEVVERAYGFKAGSITVTPGNLTKLAGAVAGALVALVARVAFEL